ncbi:MULTISPECIES: lipopolysaccharide biosynthesis protein [unclassified Oceanispirochaeta]|uniref:lipopolysaccharide biosynthesis protein n=1 Tax=unclassified Oceanispirochaeta TaxID=2635722 RepID=UPI000E09D98A|nr:MULTISPECIES: oligosaccharide flippase family protein [unclassified Oceanispirochaeta]MBF9018672.1 oligosaccharide flippase family protein [Oceanispirochaeta sp. M2]NPD75109.1 oligosaccharide flippase family protein [Oceanispirochaeta sp. M1]RDG29034.1 hypothetical protein DV872_23725 [Oceanispirochaeta sp. M1]
MSKLLKNTAIYTFFTVLQKGVGFFLLPLYTVFLSPSDYGMVTLVTSITSFLSIFYMLALNNGMGRYYYDYNKSHELIKELFGTVFNTVIFSSTFFSIIFFMWSDFFFSPFLAEIPVHPFMTLGLVSLAFEPIFQVVQSMAQIKQEANKFSIINFLYFLVSVGLKLLFIVGLHYKSEGFLLSVAISNGIFFIYSLISFYTRYGLSFRYSLLKKLLKYSLPLLPHNISGWSMTMIDRVFISKLLSVAATGIYSIGFQISNLVNVFVFAFSQAYSPFFFEQMKKGDEGKNAIIKVSTIGVLVISLVGSILSLFSKEVVSVFVSDVYFNSYTVVPFLTFVFVFTGVYIFVAGPLFISSTHIFSLVSIIGAILNILLNIIMIPRYGIIGAATASLLQRFISTLIYAFFGYRSKDSIDFQWSYIFGIPVVMFVIVMLILHLTENIGFIYTFIIKVIFIFIVIFIFGIIFPDLKIMIKQFVFKKIRNKGNK